MKSNSEFEKKYKVNASRAKKMSRDVDIDEDGNIIIKQGQFLVSTMTVARYAFVDGWILLLQPEVFTRKDNLGKMVLVKSYISDKYPNNYSDCEKEKSIANNFIMSELAKQFLLQSAEYYNAVFEDCDELRKSENYKKQGNTRVRRINPGKRYFVTPSFLEDDEELIHLADILKNPEILRVSEMLKNIEEYLKVKHVYQEDIEQIRKSFIKQCIFHKFIDFTDEHNFNSGLIISQRNGVLRARYAPEYDLDFSAEVYNTINGGIQPKVFYRITDDGGFFLDDMLEQFKGEYEKEYLKEIIPTINIQETIKKGEENGNIKLSERALRQYTRFFNEQIESLKKFYTRNYGIINENLR